MGKLAAILLKLILLYRLDEPLPFPVDDPMLHWTRLRSLRFMIEQNVFPEDLAAFYLQKLRPLADRCKQFPNPLARPPDESELGRFDIELGELAQNPGVRVGMRLNDRPRHLLASGATGMGKSSLLRSIVNRIDALNRASEKPISVLVIDTKSDFVDVADRLGRDRWDHFSVHDGFRLGLAPPECLIPPTPWINECTKIIAGPCKLILSASSLAAIIRFGLGALNESADGSLRWLSLPNVYDIARSSPPALFAEKDPYMGTLVQNLRFILENSSGIFDCSAGFNALDHLIKRGRCAVIDLSLLPPQITEIAVNLMIAQIFLPRLYDRHTVDATEVVIVIDESDHLCSEQSASAYPEGYSMLGRVTKQGREFGMMVCLGMSFLGLASQFIQSNITYHWIFGQPDERSIRSAVRSLIIPGGESLLAELEPGMVLFREAQGPCGYAMMARTDHVAPARTPRPESFDRHPLTPSIDLADLPPVLKALDGLIEQHDQMKTRRARQSKRGLAKKARVLLELLSAHPYTPVARLWRHLGKTSPSVQNAIRTELEAGNLVNGKEVRIGRSPMWLAEPSDAGYALLGKAGPGGGLGGIEHRFYQHWLKFWIEKQGWQGGIEWTVTGTPHRADAAYKDGDFFHAYEVIVDCTSNLIAHLKTCLIDSDVVSTLTIVASQKKLLVEIEKLVKSEPSIASVQDRIRYEPIEKTMLELWP
jgi:hypothetical protein